MSKKISTKKALLEWWISRGNELYRGDLDLADLWLTLDHSKIRLEWVKDRKNRTLKTLVINKPSWKFPLNVIFDEGEAIKIEGF